MGQIEVDLTGFSEWTPSMAMVRDAVLGSQIIQPRVREDAQQQFSVAQAEVDNICELGIEAITAGRAIHLGHLPNDAIKAMGDHGGPLYNLGGLSQPFSHPWLFMHTWDGDLTQRLAAAVYLVSPIFTPDGEPAGCEVAELQPCRINDGNVLLIGDRVLLDAPLGVDHRATYHAVAVPSPMRLIPGMEPMNNGLSPSEAAAGNVLDPLMAALLLMSAEGVSRVTVGPSEKLARARVKSRKPPLPSHIEVRSEPYVTAILARRAGRRAAQGGHHASPVPHIRRGHIRVLANGTRSIIRETLVAVNAEARASFQSQRSHYEVRT